MFHEGCDEQLGLCHNGQSRQPQKNHALMDERSSEDQFAEILVFGDEHGPVGICSPEDDLVGDTRLHFSDRNHFMTGLAQFLDNTAVEVFVGEEFHAAWPGTTGAGTG